MKAIEWSRLKLAPSEKRPRSDEIVQAGARRIWGVLRATAQCLQDGAGSLLH